MAGVACAWLLDGACDVVLIEAQPSLGGNVRTVDVVVDGHPYRVDAGAQYFPGPYPTHAAVRDAGPVPAVHRWLARVPRRRSRSPTGRGAPALRVAGAAGRAWPLLAAWNRPAHGVQPQLLGGTAPRGAQRFLAAHPRRVLPTLGLDAAQWEGMVLPWAASIFSATSNRRAACRRAPRWSLPPKALPPNPTDPILYYVVEQGMAEVLQRMAAQFTTVQTMLGAPVTGVARDVAEVFRRATLGRAGAARRRRGVRRLGPPTLGLLGGITGTEAQRAALQGIEFFDARLMLCTDAAYAPANPNHWSFLNGRIDGGFCEASMWLVRSSRPRRARARRACGRAGSRTASSPPSGAARVDLSPPAADPGDDRRAVRAALAAGQGGVWFAGGYTPLRRTGDGAAVGDERGRRHRRRVFGAPAGAPP